MSLSKLAVRRPVTTTMFIFIVIAFGILSITNLKMDMMPNMNIPVAIVSTSYSGVGPTEVEKLITEPLEGVLGTVPGIDTISSMSSYGSSIIILQFEDNIDIDVAALDMREKVDLIKGMLPDDASDPMVMKIDINSMSSLTIGVSSDKYDLVDLKKMVDDKMVDRLKRQNGVAQVSVSGGREKEISVTLKEDMLRGYGISESQIAQLLMSENRNTPTGTVKQGDKSLKLRVEGEFKSIDDIKNIIITTPRGANIYLNDIAIIEEVYKEQEALAFINGKPSVTLSVQKQSTANTVNVSDAVLKELSKMESEMPDLHIKVLLDPADMIRETLSSVSSSAISGAILAVAVLYIFLRNFRSTLIVAVAMPISIIATFVLMYYTKITLNMMSLGGLALGIGMLVDNSIVVLESIYRKLEEGEDRFTAAIEGAREVAMSVTASTLTTVAVFLPITFSGGMVAQIFNELSLTIAFSLTSSLVVALTFVPMASSVILNKEQVLEFQKTGILSLPLNLVSKAIINLEKGYKKVLSIALVKRKTTVFITLAFIIGTMYCMQFVPMEFLPSTDESVVGINIDMPRGTLLGETEIVANKVIERVKDIPEIVDITLNLGGSSNGFSGGSSDGASVSINLVGKQERKKSSDEIAREMSKLVQDIPGADITVEATSMSMGNYAGAGITMNIKGSDLDTLIDIAKDLQTRIRALEGTRDVTTSVEEASPQATIKINRVKASTYGLTAASIASVINTNISGTVATTYKLDGNEYDVRIRGDKANMDYISDVQNILVPSPTGINIPLYELADIVVEDMPVSINRDNQSKYVSVSSGLDGRTMGELSADVTNMMKSYPMPPNYSWEFAGTTQQMDDAFGSLGLALIIALLLVYMLMAAEFESFIYPIIVMFSIPIALTGGLFGLFVMGHSLSITAYLGLIMLAGVVINNAIVLIDYTNLLIRERNYSLVDALLKAGPVRLRPILMSTLTTVLGLVPIMLSTGEGAELMGGLGTVVVFGLSLSTLVTLLFIPVVYVIFNNIKNKFKKPAAKNELRQQ